MLTKCIKVFEDVDEFNRQLETAIDEIGRYYSDRHLNVDYQFRDGFMTALVIGKRID